MVAATEAKVTLQCPYCPQEFEVASNSDPRYVGKEPHEIACVPYTRTRGERSEGSDRWTRIGLDFYAKYANWEAIGILRVPSDDTALDVSYQLVQCPSCKRLFDAYLNWTPDRDLGELWPHLFARDASGEIKRYQGKTITLGMLDRIEKLTGSLPAAVVVVPLILLFLSFVPRFLIALAQAPDAPWQYFWDQSIVQIVTRVIGAVAVSGLLWQMATYARFMWHDRGYYDLFDVRKPEHVTHWLNYTLARLVGVQKAGSYAIDQASVLAGIPSAFILLSVWMLAQLGRFLSSGALILNLVILLVFMVAGYLWGRWYKLQRTGAPVTVFSLIFPVTSEALKGVVIAGSIWGALAVAQMILDSPGEWYLVIDAIFEAAFWALVAYYIGLGVQFAFGTNIYIYFQMSRLPLKLHPLCGFRNIKPIYRVINATTVTLLIILFMLLCILLLEFVPWQTLGVSLTPAHVLGSTSWLFDWVNIGFVLMFTVLGMASSRLFPVGAVVYFFLLLGVVPALFAGIPNCATLAAPATCLELRQGLQVLQVQIGSLAVPFMPSLVLQGAFLSLIVYLHMRRGVSLTQMLRQQAKDGLLARYEKRIVELNEQVVSGEPVDPPMIDELQKMLELHDYLLNVKVHEAGTRRMVDILSPLVFSVVLPTLVQFGIEQILQ